MLRKGMSWGLAIQLQEETMKVCVWWGYYLGSLGAGWGRWSEGIRNTHNLKDRLKLTQGEAFVKGQTLEAWLQLMFSALKTICSREQAEHCIREQRVKMRVEGEINTILQVDSFHLPRGHRPSHTMQRCRYTRVQRRKGSILAFYFSSVA